jgi:hypothetical protein
MDDSTIDTVQKLQDAINVQAKLLLAKRYPHISPSWYHIELAPKAIWTSAVLGGRDVVLIRISIPPHDPEFVPTLLRAVRQVPQLRTPLGIAKYAMVEGKHHEFKRVAYKQESDLFDNMLSDAEVEYKTITKVIAKHKATGLSVSVESETDPAITLYSRALVALSHMVKSQ